MRPEAGKAGRANARKLDNPELKALVGPVAAYIAATDDPRTAVAEVVAELIGEAIEIEVDAIRCLDRRGRSRGGRPGHDVAPGIFT